MQLPLAESKEEELSLESLINEGIIHSIETKNLSAFKKYLNLLETNFFYRGDFFILKSPEILILVNNLQNNLLTAIFHYNTDSRMNNSQILIIIIDDLIKSLYKLRSE